MAESSTSPSEKPQRGEKAKAPASSSGGSAARRALEWLWQGDALRRVALERGPNAARVSELERRAKLSLELGRNVFDPPQPFEWGSARAAACELYRQAIYWALVARQARDASPETSANQTLPDAVGDAEKLPDPALTWQGVDRAQLASLLEPSGQADSVEEALGRSFADLAELSDERLDALAEGLRKFAESLLTESDAARRNVERVLVRRFFRILLVLVALAALATLVVQIRSSYQASRDLARGKPWLASSLYGAGNCQSPLQECAESPSYFVHTTEEADPWLEIDLQQSQRFSGIQVTNRSDCCHDRGLPLVVWVSRDKARWTEVARRTTEFSVWDSSFAPVEARWVRLRVEGRGILHLHGVRVLR